MVNFYTESHNPLLAIQNTCETKVVFSDKFKPMVEYGEKILLHRDK